MEVTDFYNLKYIFRYREILQELDSSISPRAVPVREELPQLFARVGFLSGSFNPPTQAHIELALQAKTSFQLDHLFFVISNVTIGKEMVTGLLLEDRLLLLSLLMERLKGTSVLLVNRGLYSDQVSAFRLFLGNKTKIYLVVGFDKIIQLFDPSYYNDQDESLKYLFFESQILVAYRGAWGRSELNQLLTKKENQIYRDRVYPLDLSEGVREVSSSALRETIAAGYSFQKLMPGNAHAVLKEIEAFRPHYNYRQLLLDRLYSVREWAESKCDFRVLDGIAREESQRGRDLRSLLCSDRLTLEHFRDALSYFLRH